MRYLLVMFLLGMMAVPAGANPAVLKEVNALRAAKSKSALSYSNKLEAAALGHATDMARKGFFGHKGSNGSKTSQRVKAQGYCWRYVAENIAQGQDSLKEVMRAWAQSPAHYKNMMNRKARQIGMVKGPGENWVMVLARPC